MKNISDKDWDALRIATASAFLKPIDDWRDAVRGKDPHCAMAALAMFLGHMLAGLAVELGVAGDMDTDACAAVIAETMAEQLADMRHPETQGVTLQ